MDLIDTRGLVKPQPHPVRYILRVLGIVVGVYVGILALAWLANALGIRRRDRWRCQGAGVGHESSPVRKLASFDADENGRVGRTRWSSAGAQP